MSQELPPGKGYLKKIKDADGNSLASSGSGAVEPFWGPVGAYGEEPAMELVRMAVAPQARGKGLARRLAETVARHAEEYGCGWVVLSTSSEMISAVRTYDGLGFRGHARAKSVAYAITPSQLLRGPAPPT